MAGDDRSRDAVPAAPVRPGALSALLRELAAAPPSGSDAGAWETLPHPGAVVGRFELVREIGRGGFGVVFEARDRELGRRVAFKALRANHAFRLERREGLVKEAESAAQLNHENIVTLHDLGRAEFGPFLVMELLEGETLARRIGRGPLPLGAAARIATAVARALAHAHARGVVHRDLKPSNVFLCRDGRVKVLDFGLAEAFGSATPPGGTPGYMAPEQRAGTNPDARADVYSLGVTLFEMLSGRLPQQSDGSCGRLTLADLPRIRAPSVSSLIKRCLEVDRGRRPGDMRPVLRVLESAARRHERVAARQAVVRRQGTGPIWKVTKPVARQAIPRPRLFRRLEAALKQHRVVWIGSPAGSGKTTLAVTFLRARPRPCLWYELDPRDADPAAFFYYLREAASTRGSGAIDELPLLTPEYFLGVDAYARHFFERLGASMRSGTVLVLDNFQDLPENAPLQALLPSALATLPAKVTVLILSRFAPPPSFARLTTDGRLVRIGGEELNLTEHETHMLARAKRVKTFSRRSAIELRALTSGWMAGTVLLLESSRRSVLRVPEAEVDPQQVLFDYFASEIFDRASESVRRFLLETSLLPQMSASAAEALTGEVQAGEILSELVRRNLFTSRLSGAEPSYRYHPLFRSFLRARAPGVLGGARWLAVTHGAARILVEGGSADDAATLLLALPDRAPLVRLILERAPDMARQGRLASVASWLHAIPAETVERDPWLSYWSGGCQMLDPAAARRHFERAYDLFRERQDTQGGLLAWSGLVQTFFFVWDTFQALDPWIAEMDAMVRSGLRFPSADVEAQVTYGMLASLMWRHSWREDIGTWLDRASALLESNAPAEVRAQLAAYLTFHAVSWKGDYDGGARLLERMRPLLEGKDVTPLARILWDVMEAHLAARLGNGSACFAAVERGIATAAQTGVLGLSGLLAIQGVYGALASGDLAIARRYRRSAAAQVRGERVNESHLHQLGAWIALCAGDLSDAEEKVRAALSVARECGVDIAPVWGEHTLAHVLVEKGEYEEAIAMLDRCLVWARRVGDSAVEHHSLLSIAYAWVKRGDDIRSLPFLREGMRVGKERRYLTPPWIGWRRPVMARLIELAQSHGIEPDYTRELLRAGAAGPFGATT